MKQGIQTNFPHEALRESGCYFFALLRWAEILWGRSFEFSDESIIFAFNYCVSRGWVEADCFVVNPVAILNYSLEEGRYKTVYKTIAAPQANMFAVYLKKPGHGHFVLHHHGKIWDSLDPNRPGANDYSVDSYRVIA